MQVDILVGKEEKENKILDGGIKGKLDKTVMKQFMFFFKIVHFVDKLINTNIHLFVQ